MSPPGGVSPDRIWRCVIEPNRQKRFPDAYEYSCACFDAAHHNGFSGFSGVGKRSSVLLTSSWKPTESMMDKWRLNWSVCNPVWFKSTLNHCSVRDQQCHRSAWVGISFSFDEENCKYWRFLYKQSEHTQPHGEHVDDISFPFNFKRTEYWSGLSGQPLTFQTPDYPQNFRVHSCDPAHLGVELSAHSASDLQHSSHFGMFQKQQNYRLMESSKSHFYLRLWPESI